ncbi:MAG TPA: helix-turn-helix domain-containing protein [Candidatus Dormibacteraeota bacterium]|jgi:TetR/AcrR family transcriptional repressor of nem operon|nr:helix-turn-helix domain-containing protein [Candidatus Dormibacteraeota bacterium]
MPPKRNDLNRDEKIEQILDAAERRLRSGGYAALSVAGIARDLGVAQNAIHWYFPAKDHLFVAALRRMLEAMVAAKPPAATGLTTQVLWFVDELQSLHQLRAALAERARTSPLAADFHAELNRGLHGMLANALSDRISQAELPLAVDTFVATVEGCVLQDLDAPARHRLLEYALSRILGAGTPAEPGPAH